MVSALCSIYHLDIYGADQSRFKRNARPRAVRHPNLINSMEHVFVIATLELICWRQGASRRLGSHTRASDRRGVLVGFGHNL
ncbi:hypothetical protein L596_002319 [Steinernema carpocapsae]|uniref:Uncharacterized protein n=1 Tax=Steinernema carpocapsae TaxID=34508 RepID=A0A4U8UP63_STECR|nr:hypothetical protein L596_002319 [Steinernema carpocapsae]